MPEWIHSMAGNNKQTFEPKLIWAYNLLTNNYSIIYYISGDELGVTNVHVTYFVLWTIRSRLGAKSGDVRKVSVKDLKYWHSIMVLLFNNNLTWNEYFIYPNDSSSNCSIEQYYITLGHVHKIMMHYMHGLFKMQSTII